MSQMPMAIPPAVPRSRAKQHGRADHRCERRPALRIDLGAGRNEGSRSRAVAEQRREGKDRKMSDELADQHLPACDRITQQQQHRAAFHLADNGVVGDQQRNQRQEEDR
jgi:hypothetical protein